MARFKKGDRVLYYGAWGSKPPTITTITGTGRKNNKLVYDCSNGNWGYSNQFKKIPKSNRR